MKTIKKIKKVTITAPADTGKKFIRLNESWIDTNRLDKARFFRREPVVIENPENKQWVLRYALNPAPQQGIKKGEVALDEEAADLLGVTGRKPVALLVRKANWFEQHLWAWNQCNPKQRLSNWFGLIEFVLAVIGIAQTVIGLFG